MKVAALGLSAALPGLTSPIAAQAGIVAYWNFNDGGGTTLSNVMGNATLNGSLYGSPHWVAGGHTGLYGDYALGFANATAQYVKIPDNALLHIGAGKVPFTIGMWVQDSGSGYGEAFCWGTAVTRHMFWQTESHDQGASYLWSDSNGSLQFTWAGLDNTAWHHIALTADGASLRFYVDGVLRNTSVQPNINAWADLYIGKGSKNVQPWNGTLDDLIILNVAASATDVVDIKNGNYPGLPPLQPPPVVGVWTNLVSGGNWSDTNNWSGGNVASIGDADFSAIDIAADNTVHLNAPYTLQNLIFGDTGTNTAAGWILDNSGYSTNVLTLKGSISVTNLGAGKDVTISATVAGNNGMTKHGPGRLVLNDNTCAGDTAVNGGALRVNHLPPNSSISFGVGGILEYAGTSSPGGTFNLNTASAGDFNLQIDNAAVNLTVIRNGGNYNLIRKSGPGTLTLANAGQQDGGNLAVIQGAVVLSGSTGTNGYANVGNVTDVQPGAAIKLGSTNACQVWPSYGFHMSGGTFDLAGFNGGQVPAIDGSGFISNSVAGTIGTASLQINGIRTFSGNIVDGAGAARVAVNLSAGAGTWILSGNNTHSGATTVTAGIMQAGSTTALSPNSAYSIGVGMTLDLADYDNSIGSLSGAGNVTLGTATLTIGNDGSSRAAFSGVIASTTGGGITKVGSGTLTLAGANAYTGDTIVSNGTLAIGQPYLSDEADVYLATGATLALNFNGVDQIRGLCCGGIPQPPGVYGSGALGGAISGLGYLKVTEGPSVAPSIDNDGGASGISSTAAVLNGRITAGWPLPIVLLYWGDNDGGTDTAGAWDTVVNLGTQDVGAVTYSVAGLVANRTYHYRFYATNALGENWASATTNFVATPSVGFVAASSSGDESVSNVTLQIRLSDTPVVPVTLNYTAVGGTAARVVDYTFAPGTLTIPTGCVSTSISFAVVNDLRSEPDETVVIALSNPVNANLGAASTHTYTIEDDDVTPAWSFAVMADSGDADLSSTGIVAEIVQAVASENPALLIFPGDLAPSPSTIAGFQQWTNVMAPLCRAGIGVYPVRGNHESGSYAASLWRQVFSDLPTNGPPGEVGLTYSFTNMNALFLGLDEMVNPYTANQPWLDAQLNSRVQQHVFVFGHMPAFPTSSHIGSSLDMYPANRNAFWRSLAKAGVKASFCGHEHFYDHSRADDGDGDPMNDVHQFIAGTAGSSFYPDYGYTGDNGSWTPVRQNHTSQSGYLLGQVYGGRATLTFKRRTGPGVYQAGDSFTYYAENFTTNGTALTWMETHSLTNDLTDTDGDGMPEWAEYVAGTDPTNRASVLAIIKLQTALPAEGGFVVEWPSVSNRTYTLDRTTNLVLMHFGPVATNLPAVPPLNVHTDAASGLSNAAYRIRVMLSR